MKTEWWFGAAIAGINLINISVKRDQSDMSVARYATWSLCKGAAYGFLFPFSAMYIAMDVMTGNTASFRSHFVPLSLYGTAADRAEKADSVIARFCRRKNTDHVCVHDVVNRHFERFEQLMQKERLYPQSVTAEEN